MIALLQDEELAESSRSLREGKSFCISRTTYLLAHCAVQALVDEAGLTPKPALVDLRGSGAHHDLSLALLLRSARSLEPYFAHIAETAYRSTPDVVLREQLGVLGREAEDAMMRATDGVNTHRGAIWALGLLVAATALQPDGCEDSIRNGAATLAALPDSKAPRQRTNGVEAALCYGAGGARSEAEAGFPHVFRAGLPALRKGRKNGLSENGARLDALLSIMVTLEDTCLLHRGGRKALDMAQSGAARVLAHGGSTTTEGGEALWQLHESLLALWASPGGAADMLAATLFVDRITSTQERYG